MKQCNEMVQGIKVIKLLAWESYQSKKITEIRKQEVKSLFKLACFRAMFSKYYNNPKYWDRQVLANSVDPDQMLQIALSDQGLHYLAYIQQHFRHIEVVEWTVLDTSR